MTLTLNMTEAVTVVGGAPTLALNDGGTATYTGGSGTTALTFSYTVAAGQNTAALAATAVNLNGATIADGAGNAANFSLTGLNQSGPQIDTTTPTITAVATAPAGGDVETGHNVTITITMGEIVNVSGTPALALNDGGTATYVSGSGTSTLVFGYTAARRPKYRCTSVDWSRVGRINHRYSGQCREHRAHESQSTGQYRSVGKRDQRQLDHEHRLEFASGSSDKRRHGDARCPGHLSGHQHRE